jgi:hypothetical protein
MNLGRRLRIGLSLLAALMGLSIATASSPTARAQLRESFTRLPDEYTELYFAASPSLIRRNGHPIVQVPVGVLHHGKSAGTYRVTVVLTNSPTETTATTTTLWAEPDQAAQQVFDLTPKINKSGSCLVEVTLAGHSQSLHYRLKPQAAK